jgi:hypothetical protein
MNKPRLSFRAQVNLSAATTLEGVLNSAVREISQLTGAGYAAIDLELTE